MATNDSQDFHFQVPKPPPVDAVPVTSQEAERILAEQLAAAPDNPIPALWNLAQFFKHEGKLDRAFEILRDLLTRVESPETKAQIVLTLGQTAEKAADYPLAARFYREALRMEPSDRCNWYFIHNNLGFSLNELGQFAEGEACCRRAIAIDPDRSNAHKNLGLALVGQGRYREAAAAFVQATQANAADGRSCRHLADLLQEHPELVAGFAAALQACQEAVRMAQEAADKVWEQWQASRKDTRE